MPASDITYLQAELVFPLDSVNSYVLNVCDRKCLQ